MKTPSLRVLTEFLKPLGNRLQGMTIWWRSCLLISWKCAYWSGASVVLLLVAANAKGFAAIASLGAATALLYWFLLNPIVEYLLGCYSDGTPRLFGGQNANALSVYDLIGGRRIRWLNSLKSKVRSMFSSHQRRIALGVIVCLFFVAPSLFYMKRLILVFLYFSALIVFIVPLIEYLLSVRATKIGRRKDSDFDD